MSRGIMIIACGHPFYGRMAFNLAASIKAAQRDMPVALLWAGDALNHLTGYNLSDVFDVVTEIPEHCYRHEGRDKWIRTKVFMYDLSPFEETVFLDADTIWMPKRRPDDLFNELKDVEITFANYTRHDLTDLKPDAKLWANLSEVKAAYGFTQGWYYAIQSEMVYFKRSERNADYFDKVKEVYDNPKVKTTVFAGFVPDEFAFSVAAVICGIEPHMTPYYPTFWGPVHKKVERETLFDRHYVLSVGGSFQTDYVKSIYNALANVAFKKLGLRDYWKYYNKRSWLPERKQM